jgi:Histone-like transcription factor (CBF/NF-Y) and archaeal histone
MKGEKAALPLARVKAIAQEDEEFGRCAKPALQQIGACTALFAQELAQKAYAVALKAAGDGIKADSTAASSSKSSAKRKANDAESIRILPEHLIAVVASDSKYDFLRETVKADVQAPAKTKRKPRKAAKKGSADKTDDALPADIAVLLGGAAALLTDITDDTQAQMQQQTDDIAEDDDYD